MLFLELISITLSQAFLGCNSSENQTICAYTKPEFIKDGKEELGPDEERCNRDDECAKTTSEAEDQNVSKKLAFKDSEERNVVQNESGSDFEKVALQQVIRVDEQKWIRIHADEAQRKEKEASVNAGEEAGSVNKQLEKIQGKMESWTQTEEAEVYNKVVQEHEKQLAEATEKKVTTVQDAVVIQAPENSRKVHLVKQQQEGKANLNDAEVRLQETESNGPEADNFLIDEVAEVGYPGRVSRKLKETFRKEDRGHDHEHAPTNEDAAMQETAKQSQMVQKFTYALAPTPSLSLCPLPFPQH